MDPITAALAAGAAAGLTDVAAQAVKDAHGRLRAAPIQAPRANAIGEPAVRTYAARASTISCR